MSEETFNLLIGAWLALALLLGTNQQKVEDHKHEQDGQHVAQSKRPTGPCSSVRMQTAK